MLGNSLRSFWYAKGTFVFFIMSGNSLIEATEYTWNALSLWVGPSVELSGGTEDEGLCGVEEDGAGSDAMGLCGVEKLGSGAA